MFTILKVALETKDIVKDTSKLWYVSKASYLLNKTSKFTDVSWISSYGIDKTPD